MKRLLSGIVICLVAAALWPATVLGQQKAAPLPELTAAALRLKAAPLLQELGWPAAPAAKSRAYNFSLLKYAVQRHGPDMKALLARLPGKALENHIRGRALLGQAVLRGPAGPNLVLSVDLLALQPGQPGRLGRAVRDAIDYFRAQAIRTAWLRAAPGLMNADEAVFRVVNQKMAPLQLDDFMIWVSRLIPLAPLVLIGLWLLFRGGRQGRILFVGLALVFVFTDLLLTQYLRPYLARLAPFACLEGVRHFMGEHWQVVTKQVLAVAGPSYSLPSAHAANTAGPAFFLWRSHPALSVLLIAAALVVGVSRMYMGIHFPSDILAGYLWGAIWGGLLGWIFWLLANRTVRRRVKAAASSGEPPQE